MSVTHNFNIEQGSDFKITFVYQDVNGNPIDLSEGKVGFRFRALNSEGGFTGDLKELIRGQPNGYVRNGGVGEIIIELPACYTKDLYYVIPGEPPDEIDTYLYDLDFEPTVADSCSLNTRISTGRISIIKKNFNTFLDETVEDPGTPSDDDDDTGIPIGGDGDPNGDRCSSAVSCLQLDIYSRVYNGSGITIEDNSDNSGTISGVNSTQTMQKIEVAINGLKHDNPQDLTFILEPPSGDMILLSSNNKISNYDPSTDTNGFSWVFSNSASANTFLNNVENNQACNIDDKTDIVKYSSNTLMSNFDHLLYESGADGLGHSITGAYTLYANDNDRLSSGVITNWNLVITYTGAI